MSKAGERIIRSARQALAIAQSVNVIHFYRVAGDYGCFSNFAPYPIVIDGQKWPT